MGENRTQDVREMFSFFSYFRHHNKRNSQCTKEKTAKERNFSSDLNESMQFLWPKEIAKATVLVDTQTHIFGFFSFSLSRFAMVFSRRKFMKRKANNYNESILSVHQRVRERERARKYYGD